MVSLLDIAEQPQKTVAIRGKDIPVFGISADGLIYLLSEFPELRLLMSGKRDTVTPEAMMKLAPTAVAAAIAAGTGLPGDKKAEQVARSLPLGDQLELLSAVFDLTFPQGVGPFVARLEAIGLIKNAEAVGHGWAQATKSPEPSSTLSMKDMPENTSGG